MLTPPVNTSRIPRSRKLLSVPGMNLRLAVLLGFAALIRPVLSIVGAFDGGPLAKPVGPLLVTAVICVAQIAVVVVRRVPDPVLTLAAAGVAYAVFAIGLNWSLQPFLASAETIPLPGYIAMPLFNAAQGAVLGLVAWAILRRRRVAAPR